jgi:hypothetical protein
VICDCNPGTLQLCGPQALPQTVLQIGRKPDFRVTRQIHENDIPFCTLAVCGECVRTNAVYIKYRARIFCLSKTSAKELPAGYTVFAVQVIMPFRVNMAGVFWSYQLKSRQGMNTD